MSGSWLRRPLLLLLLVAQAGPTLCSPVAALSVTASRSLLELLSAESGVPPDQLITAASGEE